MLPLVGSTPFPKRNGIQKSESAKEMLIAHRERDRPLPTSTSADFPVRVEVLQHEFPPLPPSPVEEDEDEYSEILHPFQKTRADTLPNSNEPPTVPPHSEPISNSLKTRSMDVNYNRGRRFVFMTVLKKKSSQITYVILIIIYSFLFFKLITINNKRILRLHTKYFLCIY